MSRTISKMRMWMATFCLVVICFQTTSVRGADSDTGVAFVAGPYLQITGQNEMTVGFVTDQDSLGWVEFAEGQGGETLGDAPQVAYETHHGLRQNKKVFRVPLKNLKPATEYAYRICAKQITRQEPYKVTFGDTISSSIFHFKTLAVPKSDAGKEDVLLSFIVFNDLHNTYSTFEKLWSQVQNEKCDFIVMNGDILPDSTDESLIIKGLKIYSDAFASTLPMVYVRGNHETRGTLATAFRRYFAYPADEFYFDFSDAGVRFLVVDFGEDKPDSEPVYAGLNDFDTMRTEEAAWLAEAVQKREFTSAIAQVVLCHAPTHPTDSWHGTEDLRAKFAPIYNASGIDLYIAGHTHRALIVPANRYPDGQDTVPNRYPIANGDGPDEKVAVVQVFTVYGDGSIHVKQIKTDGSICEETTFQPIQ